MYYIYVYILLCILYMYKNGHKWSITRRVLKSFRSKMIVIYMQSWKQCALLVITIIALCQLTHLGTWGTAWAHDNRTSCAQVHELPQSHCGDNHEGTYNFRCGYLGSWCFRKILNLRCVNRLWWIFRKIGIYPLSLRSNYPLGSICYV